ncbi:hypothetical protein ACFV4F_06455 [Kitasatospora sp. NPDC059722]|uniref:hypothetical protein n=1 Tax=unclassified Kitasatospora TaxID=2633591 RepID=UPI00365AEA7E
MIRTESSPATSVRLRKSFPLYACSALGAALIALVGVGAAQAGQQVQPAAAVTGGAPAGAATPDVHDWG